ENGVAPLRLSPAALRELEQYDWPGNVRELQNLMERTALYCDGDVVQPSTLRALLGRALPRQSTPAADPQHGVDDNDSTGRTAESDWPSLEEVEAEHIERTLRRAA